MPAVYPASKARHAPWWSALRAAGLPIVASWVDWQGNAPGAEPTADAWSRHWILCIDEAAAADVLLFYAGEGETACGALVELGAALASGAHVYVVSPYAWSVPHHPRCRTFATLADAVEAIK